MPRDDGNADARLRWAVTLLATWFHVGKLQKAPGTYGSIAALPFAWGLVWLGGAWLLLSAAALAFIAGRWAAARYMERTGEHDPGAIVIDEVVGQWLTLSVAPLTPVAYLLGLLAFRVFDIWKPWPIGWLDKHMHGAFGVMIDDVVAAIYAGVVLYALLWMIGQ